MQFSNFISILQSPKTETYQKTKPKKKKKKVYKNTFPKIGPFSIISKRAYIHKLLKIKKYIETCIKIVE